MATFCQSGIGSSPSRPGPSSGRASRFEYWWFVRFDLVVLFVTMSIGMTLAFSGSVPDPVGLVVTLSWLALIPAELAAATRRLHDMGQARQAGGWR